MSLIERVYASAPSNEVLLRTIEILVAGQDPIRVVAAYEDLEATLETSETVTFKAGPFESIDPAKDTRGQQNLTFAIANASGEAQRAVQAAIESGEEVPINYRVFLPSDLTAPAQAPYRMKLRGGSFEGLMVQVEAGYFDLLNFRWPRHIYTADLAPGIRYL